MYILPRYHNSFLHTVNLHATLFFDGLDGLHSIHPEISTFHISQQIKATTINHNTNMEAKSWT
jgi:hypothetical protein